MEFPRRALLRLAASAAALPTVPRIYGHKPIRPGLYASSSASPPAALPTSRRD
jgi:hypothetical protein